MIKEIEEEDEVQAPATEFRHTILKIAIIVTQFTGFTQDSPAHKQRKYNSNSSRVGGLECQLEIA